MELQEFPLNQCKTMDRWIEEGKNLQISQQRISILEKIDDTIISLDNLIARYIDALKVEITDLVLSEDELDKYRYQPKALSYDLYNTTELWSGLLYINNMVSITQFRKNKIKVFKPSFMDALEELLIINNKDMVLNRDRIGY